jgi:hypothetical protein
MFLKTPNYFNFLFSFIVVVNLVHFCYAVASAEGVDSTTGTSAAATTFFFSHGLSLGANLASLGVPSAKLSGIWRMPIQHERGRKKIKVIISDWIFQEKKMPLRLFSKDLSLFVTSTWDGLS